MQSTHFVYTSVNAIKEIYVPITYSLHVRLPRCTILPSDACHYSLQTHIEYKH